MVFILFTAIGTVSHEYGHISVAKIYGYETSLHYGSMNYYPKGYSEDKDLKALQLLTRDYLNIEYDAWPEEIKEKAKEYDTSLQKRYWNEKPQRSLFITIGGPLQTVLTGTIGLIMLMVRRKSINLRGLEILDWLAIFLSLFWLREVFNLIASIFGEIISPDGNWFGGDELLISQGLHLWSGTVPIILATLGLIISVHIVFRIIPKKIRLTFILSGLIGGISGFILWMNLIGPKILP
jgi:hypothetical protein